MKHIAAILFFLLNLLPAKGQKGYEIKLSIPNLPNQKVYLAHHFGYSKFIDDSVVLDKNGRGAFCSNDDLKSGMYLIALPSSRYFDMVIDTDKHFSVESDTVDFLFNTMFKGSEENKLFYAYQQFMTTLNFQIRALEAMQRQCSYGSDSALYYDKKIYEAELEADKYMQKFKKEHPDHFFMKILNAVSMPELPDPPLNAFGHPDSAFLFFQYKAHFWDNIDFSSDELLYTPVLEPKLMEYFEDLLIQAPDSIIPEVDMIIEKSRANDRMFQYVVSTLFNYYNTSDILGLDAVFVHIAKKYYITGDAFWLEEEYRESLANRVEVMEKLLVGEKAPEIEMEQATGQAFSLHNSEAELTIVIFWEPDCGYCNIAIPKLHMLYEQYLEDGLQVVAVYTQDKKEDWLNYIEEKGLSWVNVWDPNNLSRFRENYAVYQTPTIFLLDENKEILAKEISVEQTERLLHFILKGEMQY